MERTNEKELSLYDLMWKVLLGWRRWIIMGIVFAVLMSGLGYTRSMATYQNILAQQQGENMPSMDGLTEQEMAQIEDIRRIERKMDEIRKYLDESVYMNLKSDNTYKLVLNYYVDTEYTFNYTEENTADYVVALTNTYKSYAVSGELAKIIKENLALEIEEGYINELITAVSEGTTFQVQVLFDNVEMLEQMAPVIEQAIQNQKETIETSIGTHKLYLVKNSISAYTDTEVNSEQKIQNDMIYSYIVELNAIKGALNSKQQEFLQASEQNVSGEMPVVAVKPAFNVMYTIVGFMAGVFLACVWLIVEALFATKLQKAEDIAENYKIRMLGELTNPAKKKKIFAFVDNFMLKLKNRNKKQLTGEQQTRIICYNLELACKKASVDRIYFTGSEIEKIDQTLLAEIKKILSSAGIQVHTGENISYDAKSLKEMAEMGYVVFVEQVGLSIYKEIEKEIKLAKENMINILGSIVIV